MCDKIISWEKGTVPKSILYDDIYYSTEDGLAESKAVFLDGIGAPDVWKNGNDFTICELGFGTGLNFLNCVNLWLNTSDKTQTLNYIATEKHPLSEQDIRRAIKYPTLQPILDDFIVGYPEKCFDLFNERVRLNLLIGDSLEQISGLKIYADAWFLDGFAPRKNPDMWSNALFREIGCHSRVGAKLATFTSAGFVRRGLTDVGFQMEKRPGFGKKREMLNGVFMC